MVELNTVIDDAGVTVINPAKDLVARLRKQAVCVYLATEEGPASDIADGLTKAADMIETLAGLKK